MSQPRTWLLSDHAAGNRRQVAALAEALALDDAEWIEPAVPAPLRWLAPWASALLPWCVPHALRERLRREPPQLAIGCGRQAAQLTHWLRRRHGCYAVQILHPRRDPRGWDLIVTPAHDGVSGPNVLTTLGSLHPWTPQRLNAAAQIMPAITNLPAPRIALVIGGPTRAFAADQRWLERSLARLDAAVGAASFVISASARTPPEWRRVLQGFASSRDALCWTGPEDGPNPYPALLGAAERIVVSADSVNLASEACASGRPVHVLGAELARGRLARFHAALCAAGQVSPLEAPQRPAAALVETPVLAAEVWRRYRLAQGVAGKV